LDESLPTVVTARAAIECKDHSRLHCLHRLYLCQSVTLSSGISSGSTTSTTIGTIGTSTSTIGTTTTPSAIITVHVAPHELALQHRGVAIYGERVTLLPRLLPSQHRFCTASHTALIRSSCGMICNRKPVFGRKKRVIIRYHTAVKPADELANARDR
jgi:hypothetical protein